MLDTNLHPSPSTSCPKDKLLGDIQGLSKFPAVIEAKVEIEPIPWLREQHSKLKLAWGSCGSRDIVIGLGHVDHLATEDSESAADIISRCRSTLAKLPEHRQSELRWFGGFAFRRAQRPNDPAWSSFGQGSFWLPRATLVANQRLLVIVRSHGDVDAAREFIDGLHFSPPVSPASESLPEAESRVDSPTRGEWLKQIEAAKILFTQEVLEKIVLARKVDYQFPVPIDPLLLLQRLIPKTPACYHFCFQTSPSHAFIGASPEKLFLRRGRELASEVVAGTRPRGRSETMDEELGRELLASSKDQMEHDIVRKSIRQRLHSVVEQLDVDAQASLLKLANKQHLFSRVSGKLKPHVDDGELIDRLHPTPAVGGYPTENALNEIQQLEPFDRGWYAAPIGWVGAKDAEFAVGIRSGLVQGKRLSLYSGAGIVPGSDPTDEWNEIEHKISDFVQLFTNVTGSDNANRSQRHS